jgi:superfamily II DNA or RNA helicase
MLMELRNYQREVILKVTDHLKENKRCCVSLATGGGKTVIFSELVNMLKGKTLVCVHREELVFQTSRTLTLDHDVLLPKTKSISKDICVAMVQTLHNRLKKELIDINDFDNLIIDEAHRGEFMKILDKFNGNVIGFTATPNYEKNRYFFMCLECGKEYDDLTKCCNKKTKKAKENTPLAEYYHTLIEGVEIDNLIEQGYLVPDENYILENDTSRLVFDPSKGDYTEESVSLVFGSDEAIENTINVYKDLALNQKTIVFNPNTLVNKRLYNKMVSYGFNVKMFDSNNSEENRHELVEWFKNTKDAILLNVQVFTTGFDCTDVEVVFLNKKTKSINLYLQMVGRGGRITDKILKPSFKVIDMGNNNEDFGKWSDPRNWNRFFYHKEQKLVGQPNPASVRNCHKCESIVSANSLYCEVCGAERLYTNGGVTGLPTLNGKPVIPTPEKIVEYCEINNLDCLQARKIVFKYVAQMFIKVSFEVFKKHEESGNLYQQTKKYITPYYFAIQKSKLEGNRVMTINNFTNKTIKEIERRYTTSANL